MAKAIYKCECGKSKIVNFKPGEKLDKIICDCGKEMKRQFGKVNVGYIEDDDILSAGFMMTYQASNSVK